MYPAPTRSYRNAAPIDGIARDMQTARRDDTTRVVDSSTVSASTTNALQRPFGSGCVG